MVLPVVVNEEVPGEGAGLLLPVVPEGPGPKHLEHSQVGAIMSSI